jgi:hypothetical protein
MRRAEARSEACHLRLRWRVFSDEIQICQYIWYLRTPREGLVPRSKPVSRGDVRPNDKNAIAQLAPVRYENATRWVCFFGSPRKCRRWCSVPDGTGGNRGGQPVCYGRVIAVGMLIASAIVLPTSEASARCWHNGWGWRCGPGLLALPFVAAGAVVAGAAAVATAPVRAIFGPPYYAPPPAYYAPPAYYPPAYYYGPPPR